MSRRAKVFLLCLTVRPILPQASDGNILGTITDQSNAPVAGATVVAANIDTGVAKTATTDALGGYRFANMPVGRYEVSAVTQGFAKHTLENVTVELNRTVTVNIGLAVSAVATSGRRHRLRRRDRHHHRANRIHIR
jgi:hypothetical protein